MDAMQSFTWREFLIGSIVALAIYVAVELLAFLRASRKPGPRPVHEVRHAHEAYHAPEMRHEKAGIESLREEVSALRDHIASMQKEIDRLREESEAPAPYSQAIRMVRQGLGPAEIAVACDISKGEAELIASLHKGKGI